MRLISVFVCSNILAVVWCTTENGDRSGRKIESWQVQNLVGRQRPAMPPYAVAMEPLVKYSQRDPLYHALNKSSEDSGEERDPETQASESYGNRELQRYDSGPVYHPHYYHDQEPIIEIIIKESNESLPTTPAPSPPPRTREPVHVFYIKYKKNPNPKGKNGEDDIIYEPPVPALTPTSPHTEEEVTEPPKPWSTHLPPPSTTLRTIIRPDSEVYHGSGLKITFGRPEEEEEEHSALEESAPEPNVATLRQTPEPSHQVKRQGPYQRQEVFSRGTDTQEVFRRGSEKQEPLQRGAERQESFLRAPQRQESRRNQGVRPSTGPTPAQILQYRQEKERLYQESLKQQQAVNSQGGPTFAEPYISPSARTPGIHSFSNQRLQQPIHVQGPAIAQPFRKPAHYQNYQSGFPEQTAIRSNYHQTTSYNYYDTTTQATFRPFEPVGSKTRQSYQGRTTVESGPHRHSSYLPENHKTSHQDFGTPPVQTSSSKQTFNDGVIVKSISQSEQHQIEPAYKDPSYREPEKHQFSKIPSTNHGALHYNSPSKQGQQLAAGPPQLPHFHPPPSPSTLRPHLSTPQSTQDPQLSYQKSTGGENDKKKADNIAALPDEVPEDLRQQLVSSGILSNADIQILDYDKVGDIPIESLPQEALEGLYGAGSEPQPSVARPQRSAVEMKVVRYNPSTEEGQDVPDKYLREDATQLDPVLLNDSKYNRYLPLKLNGTQFPIPDVPQLQGKLVKSVVVLAPVDYDFVKETVSDGRGGKAIQVQGVKFLAGESLRRVVKEPTKENFADWLDRERNSSPENQSVILLLTRNKEVEEKEGSEIFMYELSSGRANRLRGELSSTFVQVAESNSSSSDLEGLGPADSTS